jgi:predicted acylesterase/phospholipase RssA
VDPEFRREIRFALVLYGGVSLAVYMCGVAQEFLRLVRATSVSHGEAGAGVYRKLAELVQSRFAVDIASGSSAGGINALFLGKALATGHSLDHLAKLWVEDADLDRLWNRDRRPRSLLSSKYLRSRLAAALDAMSPERPLQPSMDVFVTATDLEGLNLPIELTDMTVAEKRHKSVFHFRFDGSEPCDFAPEMNPLLTFAARATSAFPFAFEPARPADFPLDAPENARFFEDYGADYAQRRFADGGILENKPFSHAIRQLPRAVSDLPSRRVLMYVEPVPDPPRTRLLAGLNRQETIREDLERIIERNRTIHRVREATEQVEQDVERWAAGGRIPGRCPGGEYSRRTLADEVRLRGPGYAAYHRLKVRAVTDELIEIVMSAAGACGSEAAAGALRKSIGDWRARAYAEDNPHRSESAFLLQFDLGYRQRRLRFLLSKADEAGDLRRTLSRLARDLDRLEQRLHRRGPENPAHEAVQSRDADRIAAALREQFREATEPAAAELERCLQSHPLGVFFERYEYYDQVAFPILYETQVGAPEPVDVYRISPCDARSLIDEQSAGESRRKLAGSTLFHFGGFLKQEWRENDLMWGRLDGAERIVSAILPEGSPDRERLIREAHIGILEEILGGAAENMYEVLRHGRRPNPQVGKARLVRVAARAAWIALRILAGRARKAGTSGTVKQLPRL